MISRRAFTWWELLVLLLITAVLSGITIPKFKALIVRAKEANTKAGLASMRSAIQLYFTEHNAYPEDKLECLIEDAKYMPELPITQIPNSGHADSNKVLVNSDITDEGGWLYYNDKTAPASWGKVLINCSHSDSLGAMVWSEL